MSVRSQVLIIHKNGGHRHIWHCSIARKTFSIPPPPPLVGRLPSALTSFVKVNG